MRCEENEPSTKASSELQGKRRVTSAKEEAEEKLKM
jgi:hypothetical protein